MADIGELKNKYIKRMAPNAIYKEPLKQNLQSDINKVEAIIRKLSEKQAPASELNRLRTTVSKLISVIDNNYKSHL